MYLNYLIKLGFNISLDIKEEVRNFTKELLSIKEREAIVQWYQNLKSDKYHDNLHLI